MHLKNRRHWNKPTHTVIYVKTLLSLKGIYTFWLFFLMSLAEGLSVLSFQKKKKTALGFIYLFYFLSLFYLFPLWSKVTALKAILCYYIILYTTVTFFWGWTIKTNIFSKVDLSHISLKLKEESPWWWNARHQSAGEAGLVLVFMEVTPVTLHPNITIIGFQALPSTTILP